jgi:hypothetical protein
MVTMPLTGTFLGAFPLPASEVHADMKKITNIKTVIAVSLIDIILVTSFNSYLGFRNIFSEKRQATFL